MVYPSPSSLTSTHAPLDLATNSTTAARVLPCLPRTGARMRTLRGGRPEPSSSVAPSTTPAPAGSTVTRQAVFGTTLRRYAQDSGSTSY